mmetsp:Transcript_61626/g.161902  ORF Transcript_61626/g.161902 Transcript_61626/m.161902 type:complete len:376 (-) Transcript_61626:351-1478(-)
MYGTQDASAIWQQDWTDCINEGGYSNGKSQPAVFANKEKDARGLCHGDDFCLLAEESVIDEFEGILKKKYDLVRTATLGFGEGEQREASFLNRIVHAVPESQTVEFEADQRHADLIVRELSLGGAKGVVTPRVKRKASEVIAGNNSAPLSSPDATRYRSVTMRAAYLAQDRPDLGEAVKCRARSMQDPRDDHWQELKRLGRYVAQRPRCVQVFRRQKIPVSIHIYVDSDQNGDPITRKSTTGYVAMFGQHVIKFGSNMQSVIGLSSAEAEYYGLTKGAAIGLGLKSLAEDWFLGVECKVHFAVYSDSSAALAFASRRGLGTMRHRDQIPLATGACSSWPPYCAQGGYLGECHRLPDQSSRRKCTRQAHEDTRICV